MPKNVDGALATEQRSSQTVNAEHHDLPSRALDRRTRRHKQAAREEEVAQRQHEGMKPFYLTLDSEGKPYGIGASS